MTESAESREYVAEWLRQVPDFMAELGIKDTPDLAARLRYLGSGGRADVVSLGERNGVKTVLKITNDSAQAALSMAAFEDRPLGVVPIYDVVETENVSRAPLPELPKKGQQAFYNPLTWGVVEKFVVPIGGLHYLGSTLVAGDSPGDLLRRYAAAWRAYEAGTPASDPLVEEWRLLYAAALEWVEETCVEIGSAPLLDLHEDNWGVDPDTGELLLIDLGQCYAPETGSLHPNPGPHRTAAQKSLVSKLWGLVHRQEFLKATRRPYRYLDDDIKQTMLRLKRQDVHPGDVEWERLSARASARRLGEIV